MTLPIVIMISGQGTNLGAILVAIDKGLAVEIRAVISNKADAPGLKTAEKAGIPTHAVLPEDYDSGAAFESALRQCVDQYAPKLIALAGFMRKLTDDFVAPYAGRIINIHPSLLPKHRGLNTHARVLEAGDTEHGASLHFITEILDGGPIIYQARLSVGPKDTPDTLKGRVQALEHQMYPLVLRWFAADQLLLKDNHVFLEGKLLPPTGFALKIDPSP